MTHDRKGTAISCIYTWIALVAVGVGAVLIVSLGCDDSAPGRFPSVALSEIPLSQGTEWSYVVSSSVTLRDSAGTTYPLDGLDTVVVTIDESYVLPGGRSVTRWTLDGRGHADSSWFAVHGDTLTVQIPGTLDLIPIPFPLEPGQLWFSGGVSLHTSITSIDGVLQNRIGLVESRDLDNALMSRHYEIEPDLGVQFMIRVTTWPDSSVGTIASLIDFRRGR